MIKAFIKGWKKVQQGDTDSKHSFTVYIIEVNNNGLCHSVTRRYSEFDDLYKTVKKLIPISELPEFPGKHLMNRSSRLLEQRRLSLDLYIRAVLRYYGNDLHSLPIKLVTFLNLTRENPLNVEGDESQDNAQNAGSFNSFSTSGGVNGASGFATHSVTHPVMIFSDKPALESVFAAFSSGSLDSRTSDFRCLDSRFEPRPFANSAALSTSPTGQARKINGTSSPWRASPFFPAYESRSIDPRPLSNVVLEGTLHGLYGSPVLPDM